MTEDPTFFAVLVRPTFRLGAESANAELLFWALHVLLAFGAGAVHTDPVLALLVGWAVAVVLAVKILVSGLDHLNAVLRPSDKGSLGQGGPTFWCQKVGKKLGRCGCTH